MGRNIAIIVITVCVTVIGIKLTSIYGIIGFAPTVIIAGILVYFKYRVELHLEDREKKRFYAAEVWGFVEHTRFPGDDEELIRAQDHRDWLEKVGNDLDVPVLTVIWKEKNPNEKWIDFLVRVGQETEAFLSKRDRDLQKAVLNERVSKHHGQLTQDWYHRVALGKKVPERRNGLNMEILN